MLAIAVAALVVIPLAPTTQATAVDATDVDITLPDIVILHYFSDVDVEISNGALCTFLTGSLGDSSIIETTPVLAAGGLTQDLSISPTAALTGDPTAAVLTLQNAWAVRAISLSVGTNTQLAIANTDATLDHASTSATITVDAVAVDDGTSNGTSIQLASRATSIRSNLDRVTGVVRVDAAGRPAADMPLLVIDNEGQTLKRISTDRCGLYRVDGLRPERYVLRPAPETIPPRISLPPELTLDIGFEFLFGQDLRLNWSETREQNPERITAVIE